MRLTMKNTGKISRANVEIDAITVIAGENNTGKSTVGKVLFCMFNSFYRLDERIREERAERIWGILRPKAQPSEKEQVCNSIVGFIQSKIGVMDDVAVAKELVSMFADGVQNADIKASDISNILAISEDDLFAHVLENKFYAEFKSQINNVYCGEAISEIELHLDDRSVKVVIEDDQHFKLNGKLSLDMDAIYIDYSYALEDAKVSMLTNFTDSTAHRLHLLEKLIPEAEMGKHNDVKDAFSQIYTSKKLKVILEKLERVYTGDISVQQGGWSYKYKYKEKDSDTLFEISNMSTGLKTFAILKALLMNGSLEENGVIILDEPEIHLHPEWQLVLAELIVLLQKEYNLRVLVNTHSPYFLDAIDVYSIRHGVSEKCKFYLSESIGKVSEITDVSDCLDEIYKKLHRPFQTLENERYGE